MKAQPLTAFRHAAADKRTAAQVALDVAVERMIDEATACPKCGSPMEYQPPDVEGDYAIPNGTRDLPGGMACTNADCGHFEKEKPHDD